MDKLQRPNIWASLVVLNSFLRLHLGQCRPFVVAVRKLRALAFAKKNVKDAEFNRIIFCYAFGMEPLHVKECNECRRLLRPILRETFSFPRGRFVLPGHPDIK